MPAPTNPKKRALMPSSPLRKALRSAGHHLSAVVQIGKEGVTEPVLRQLDEALRVHELVKVKVGTESPEDRFAAADRLGAAVGAQIAQILGRTVLVYRRHPERPRFEPLEAGTGAELAAAPAKRRAPAPRPAAKRGGAPKRGTSAPKRRGAPKRGARARPPRRANPRRRGRSPG
jgi:RNA-binding protein